MDDGRSGALTAAGLSCRSELPPNSKFWVECGAPLTPATRSAEYKQVTVLFADVVHSMDIAGDGIMAVFGAPITMEDHAVRACLAHRDHRAGYTAMAASLDYKGHTAWAKAMP